eukprot:jgi/Phyca11/541795/estExt2_Genewise1Plus.C_PHYCAscaffold_70711
MEEWDVAQIPSLHGKVAVVTGANSGLGYETALQLALKGAHVVLACRDEAKGLEAAARLNERLGTEVGRGSVQFLQLDDFVKTHKRLDLLINNAGIMGGEWGLSADGYERQFATNHLGHFALTAQLFPLLKTSKPSRIVNVSSIMHRSAPTWNEDEIVTTKEETYRQMDNYGVTKLCNVLFTKELARRIESAGIDGVTATACHPGVTASNLATASTSNSGSWLWWFVYKATDLAPRQSCPMGALPTLYAATGSEVGGGDFFGPKHLKMFGYPVREDPSELSKSESGAKKLWTLSERLAHLSFDINA